MEMEYLLITGSMFGFEAIDEEEKDRLLSKVDSNGEPLYVINGGVLIAVELLEKLT